MKACQAFIVSATAIFLSACQNDSQSPPSRPEPPVGEAPEPGALAPLDLVYICGNKFLAINRTRSAVRVTYRVVGSDESGSLTLDPASLEDEGFGESELETIERGNVELFHDESLIVRRRNTAETCGGSGPGFGVARMAESGAAGQWSPPFSWANVAVHLSLLPDGQVLSFGLSGNPQVWNPASGEFSSIPSPAEIFCAGHSFLADGRLLVSGGNNHPDVALNGIPDNTIFDPVTRSWSRSTPMRFARWYPTNTTLANGDVVIMSGKDEVGNIVREPEVWSSGSLRVLSTAALGLPLYPRAFLAPNGKVFVAGHSQMSRYLDPTGTGSWTSVGNRLYGSRDYGAAVMYDVGKILYAGGGRTTNTAETIDLNSGAPAWKWTGSMAFARRHLNATVLPTGEVLVTGGTSGTEFNDPTRAVRAAEIWDPATGVWTTLASNAIDRVYHSTSILLPDGRVLHTGSGDAGPDQRNAELFSPPYLSRGPRPTISSGPTSLVYGGSFKITTPEAATIAKVSLIRIGSVTHAFDMNQRFQRLSFERGAGELTITSPNSANVAPPGHYMLFVLNGEGVPSIGKIVRLGTIADPPPANSPPTAAFSETCTGLTCAFSDGSTDGDGTVTSWHWEFGDGSSTTSQNPSHSYGAEGSYAVTLRVTDEDGAPATVTRTVVVTPPSPNSAPVAGFSQACTGFSCSFTDGSTDGDGTVTSWNWAFGDGSSSTAQNPEHTYGSEGPYEVSLSVTDDDGAPATATKTVTVTPPPPNSAPSAGFSETCTGLGCTFTDQSTDSDGSIASWSWDFGDGSSATTQNPTHTYGAGGSYQVTLTITDNAAAPASVSKTVVVTAPPPNSAPTAAFSQTCTGLTCVFTDGSTDLDGTVTGWSWNFGDGTTAATRNPTHTFAAGGTFVVSLVATDDRGATGTTTKSLSVIAPPSNVAPTAAFVVSCAALSCRFTNRSTDADGSIVAYRWTFGSSTTTTATAPNPSRTYPAAGTYTVTLRVTDDDGATNTRTQTITITAAIKLTVTGRVDATKQYVTVRWSGARGSTVDLYRNKVFLKQEPNDGLYTASRALPGLSKYTFSVCELGSTTLCSNEASVTF